MATIQRHQFLFLVGRVLVGGMYVGAGIMNLFDLDGKAGYTASKGLAHPHMWVIVASVLLLLAGASLMTGLRPTIGVGALFLFLVPVTLIMHNFWAETGLNQINDLHAFMSNVGLLGSAMMFLAIPQPWELRLEGLPRALRAVTRKDRSAHTA
jgi:putative oxidoreductase